MAWMKAKHDMTIKNGQASRCFQQSSKSLRLQNCNSIPIYTMDSLSSARGVWRKLWYSGITHMVIPLPVDHVWLGQPTITVLLCGQKGYHSRQPRGVFALRQIPEYQGTQSSKCKLINDRNTVNSPIFVELWILQIHNELHRCQQGCSPIWRLQGRTQFPVFYNVGRLITFFGLGTLASSKPTLTHWVPPLQCHFPQTLTLLPTYTLITIMRAHLDQVQDNPSILRSTH